jgi:hypothetical protein
MIRAYSMVGLPRAFLRHINTMGSGHALDQLDDSLSGLFDWESGSHFKSE